MRADRMDTTVGDLIATAGGNIKTGPFGTVLKAAEYSKSGVPVISVGEIGYGVFRIHDSTPRVSPNVTSRLSEYLLREGDIVFGRKGAVDRSARVGRDQEGWFLGSDGIRLRPPSGVDSRFLAYALQSPSTRQWLLQHATGTTMASLNQGVIERIPLILPALAVQRAIAAALGALDDKIELNRRMNETLEKLARTIFKSWFVDFDPVRAKAEGRQPIGMDAHTADLFPGRLVESELGEVPKGWRLSPALTMFSLLSGGTPKTDVPEFWGGDIKWASAKDVSQGSNAFFLLDTERRITQLGLDSSAAKLVPADSVVVVARGATCGRSVVLGQTMAMNQTCYALVPLQPDDRWFVCFAAADLLRRLVRQAHGSVFDTITTSTFQQGTIIVPPDALRATFGASVAPLIERVRAAQRESAVLAELRDLLLPKLISGELRVSTAEKMVEAAL